MTMEWKSLYNGREVLAVACGYALEVYAAPGGYTSVLSDEWASPVILSEKHPSLEEAKKDALLMYREFVEEHVKWLSLNM